MNKIVKRIREEEGTNVVFRGKKLGEGDIVIAERRRNKPKGVTISGAAKMKAAYKKRMASKGKKR